MTARRLAAAAVAAGSLVGALALPASAADHGPRAREAVSISGVRHEAGARDDRSNRALNQEWVQITNDTRRGVNLDGWTLSDADGHTFTFHHYRLDGRSTVRVHTGYGRDTRTDLYQDRNRSVWDRRSDTATLRNDHGRFVDAVRWGGDRRGDERGGRRHH
ncbi:lamin tail domain-containing protein [Streptomyces tropicalis]|uniref:Lamin tail domain-containing protein n=1 Tax=Streptomyces tropicalis TaxID=3034234 RepID=A0ABT6AEK7_9ACTN|nr:lamin tail domain-containing protein [Streptomyces tropicalis]MDF3303088.1 lamin tail domain-containing protein [Streptomyces tropicalis]